MNQEFWCKCGFGPDGKKEIDKHVYEKCITEKGKHGRIKSNPGITEQPAPALDAPVTPVVDEEAVPTPALIKPAPSTKTAPGVDLKKTGGRRWWMVWVGVVSVAVSIPIFMLSNNGETPNTILQLFFALFFLGGAGMAWFGIKKREESVIFKDIKSRVTKPFKGRANCVNVYYRLDRGKLATDRIAFEQLDEATLETMESEGRLSKLHRCRNDGNYYYIHELMPEKEKDGKWKPATEWKLYPFMLTDTVYFSPRELANVVTMPASTRYARPHPNKFDKIKPALLMVGAGIMAVLIVVFSGPA